MASLQHVSLGSVQQCDSVRWAAPKKSSIGTCGSLRVTEIPQRQLRRLFHAYAPARTHAKLPSAAKRPTRAHEGRHHAQKYKGKDSPKGPTRRPTPSPRHASNDMNIYNTTLLSPQKPIVAQLHDHGHLAVELDALEGYSRAMPLQGVVAPPGRGLFQSVCDRRPVVLVFQLFC